MFQTLFAIDAVHPNDNYEYVNLGLELAFKNMVYLRLGYPSFLKEDSIQGGTFGAGINYKILRTSTYLKLEYSTEAGATFTDICSIASRFIGLL